METRFLEAKKVYILGTDGRGRGLNKRMFTENISLLAALGAGFISFISPCVLPLIPGYLSFISGVSVADMSAAEKRGEVLRKVALSSFIFVLGFSAVFIAL